MAEYSQASDNLSAGAAETSEKLDVTAYRPNKRERFVRRRVYERFDDMKTDQNRLDAEDDWELGDEMFGQYIPEPDTDDWRAHLVLPDAFSGVQAHMQETIDRNSRPYLRRVEDSDKGIETFQNAVLTYSLNRTGYDFQYFLAKYSAAIRGTAHLVEKYRVDKRKIQDPVDVNEDGTLEYKEKEVIDYDDAYTEWVPNEFIFKDPGAKCDEEMIDGIIREVLDVDEFKRAYGFRKDFINLDKVQRGGETTTKSFFKLPHDLNENQVEVLHYHNRAQDCYYVVANNVVVRMGPMPTKHKEVPITTVFHYLTPGSHYGKGVPQVIHALSEERASIRNLNLDRQKMQINKMFLINDQVDIDEEEAVTRPHGFINISTNGLSIRDAIQPLEYGDVPASAFKTGDELKEDIRRATGIDDRIEGVQSGGTATEASFLKESSQKRINLIAKIAEMDAVKRIGKLKWSNIQFYYPAPRIERVTEDNEEREKKTYRKINVEGQSFEIVKDPGTNKTSLKVNEVEGTTTFKLDKSMARFMEGDNDVVIDAESITVVSKALQQAKITEMFTGIAAIPPFLSEVDPRKALTRILEVNQEQAKNWLRGNGKTDQQQMMEAESENLVMREGVMLSPTEGANEMHTLTHLHYTQTAEFQQLGEGIRAIFMQHIAGEHESNPATGSVADALGGPGGGPSPVGPVAQLPPPSLGSGNPSIQPTDLTPSTVTGETPNSSSNQ